MPTRLTQIITAFAAAGVLAASLAMASPGAQSDPQSPTGAAAGLAGSSARLPQYDLDSPGARAVYRTEREMRAVGAHAIEQTPLPPGRTVSIDWVAGAEQGGDNAFGIRAVVEFNAACQWIDYAIDHPEDPAIAAALGTIGEWPTMRGDGGSAEQFTALASAYEAGDAEPLGEFARLNCR